MATVTRQWSSEELAPGESAAYVFEVLGAATAREAIGANGVPGRGSWHPEDRLLIAKQPNAQRKSPNGADGAGGYWHVRVAYVLAESDEGKENENEDPLAKPATYRWRLGLQGEQFDRDIEGNPIVNSAREPFSTPPTADVMTLTLTVERNERAFNLNKAFFFHNAVNSDVWVVPGTGGQTVQPGQARCLSIQPTSEYSRESAYVPIAYEIEFQADGFDIRILNQGPRAATGNANGASRILDSSQEPVTTDVLLNARGQPLKEGYTVDGSAFSYLDPPAGAEIEETPDAVFLRYKRNPRRPFSQMGLT